MDDVVLDGTKLIAPCGINCGICQAFLRDNNKCEGCWGSETNKLKHCVNCSIKNCEFLAETESKFCFDCSKFPCLRLKQLDKRYIRNYYVSNLSNLKIIKESGLKEFVILDTEKWRCRECGGVICMHRGYCSTCGKTTRFNQTFKV